MVPNTVRSSQVDAACKVFDKMKDPRLIYRVESLLIQWMVLILAACFTAKPDMMHMTRNKPRKECAQRIIYSLATARMYICLVL